MLKKFLKSSEVGDVYCPAVNNLHPKERAFLMVDKLLLVRNRTFWKAWACMAEHLASMHVHLTVKSSHFGSGFRFTHARMLSQNSHVIVLISPSVRPNCWWPAARVTLSQKISAENHVKSSGIDFIWAGLFTCHVNVTTVMQKEKKNKDRGKNAFPELQQK